MCILVLISFKINVLHISTQVSGIVHSWSPGNVGLLFLPLTVILSLSFSSHQYHPLTSTSTTSTTSITDKLKSLFPSRHYEHNDKYQEKPDSLPLEVVKMWSHNRERERQREREREIDIYAKIILNFYIVIRNFLYIYFWSKCYY